MVIFRKFDLDAAIAGAPIITARGLPVEFIRYMPDVSPQLSVIGHIKGYCDIRQWDKNGICSDGVYYHNIFMEPLAIIEGKPIYKGDEVYNIDSPCNSPFIVEKVSSHKDRLMIYNENVSYEIDITNLTLIKPKLEKKGWVNIYGKGRICTGREIYPTKEDALNNSAQGPTLVDTIEITWKE